MSKGEKHGKEKFEKIERRPREHFQNQKPQGLCRPMHE